MLAKLEEFEALLRQPGWPEKGVRVEQRDGVITSVMDEDGGGYPVIDGVPVLASFRSSVLASLENVQRPVIDRSGGWLRSAKRRFMSLLDTGSKSCAQMSRMAELLKQCAPRPLLLVIGGGACGAGTEPVYGHPDIRVLGFDIYASPNVQFIADAHDIPLAGASVDGVVIQAVLEHVLDPARVVSEIRRVLKPGGLVYAETPFMQQVHEGAYDFTRFSELGHRWLFRDFEAIERGAHGGPGLSLYWSARYFFRALLRNRGLAEILALPFVFFYFLDRFAEQRHSVDGANGVYFLGRRGAAPGVMESGLRSEYLGAQR